MDDEIRAYYEETGIERDRLTKGYSRLEEGPSTIGTSAHLLAIGRRP